MHQNVPQKVFSGRKWEQRFLEAIRARACKGRIDTDRVFDRYWTPILVRRSMGAVSFLGYQANPSLQDHLYFP